MKKTIYILLCTILLNLTSITSIEATTKTVPQETAINLKVNRSIRNKKKSPKKIKLTDGKKGKYGKYDLFDGEPYLRYYVPAGTYKVKCTARGGFYVETIKIHKEDGYDTPTTIKQVTISQGEKTKIKVKKGQCISLYINTEIVLIRK